MPYSPVKKICCIGAGYVGGPTCAVIANKCPDIEVTVVDVNTKRIAAWQSDNLPIYEPNLYEMVVLSRDGIPGERRPNLFFSIDIDTAIVEADLIFLCVNTPTKVSGLGTGCALDLGYLEAATRKIAQVSQSDKIIVEKSTVPCRTAISLRDILATNGAPGVRLEVLSNPEFLAQGTTISDLLNPDRILIGSLPAEEGLRAAATLADIYAAWLPRSCIIDVNSSSSELAKVAANVLLAQRISSINALSAICEATGAQISEVAHAVGLDKRIGPHMLKSSVGFGGSCFKKDVLGLVYLSESLHLPEAAAYWRSIIDINEWQKDRFAKRVISCLNNTLVDKRVALLGFAYKKNTDDTRESAAISIVNSLVNERARVAVYDPQVREEQVYHDLYATNPNRFDIDEYVTVAQDPYKACEDAHAVVILTECDEFRSADLPPNCQEHILVNGTHVGDTRETIGTNHSINGQSMESSADTCVSVPHIVPPKIRKRLEWPRIASLMSRPMFVFDGRNIVDRPNLEKLGFRVECIGHPRAPSSS